MKLISRFLLPLAILTGLAGCTVDNLDNNESPKEPTKDSITIPSSENLSPVLDSNGGTFTISFTASDSWTAKPANDRADSWISISPDSGDKGSAVVSISVSTNETYEERNAIVTITSGSAKKNISITQKQNDALTVTSSKFEIDKEGGEILVEVKSNIDFEVSIPEASKNWVHNSTSSTKGLTTHKLTFAIDANDDTEKREGEIIIRSGELSETIHIYQAAGGNNIVLSQSEYTVGTEGGTLKVELKSNCNYKTIMPDADWVKESTGTKAVSTHTLYFEISPNEAYDNRSADIIFIDTEETISDTLRIIQVQKDAIILSKKVFEVSQEGGEFDIELNANIDYSFFVPDEDSWIRVREVATKGLISSKLHVEVERNSSFDNRSGKVIIKNTNKLITDTVYIEQVGGPYFKLSQKEVVLTYKAAKFTVEVKSNFKVIVNSPNTDWLSSSSHGEGYNNGIYRYFRKFDVKVNNSGKDRVENIYILSEDGHHIDTVFVTQMPQQGLVISKNDFNISEKGGYFEYEYKTESDCDITVSDDWIKVTTAPVTRTFTDYYLQIEVAPNTTSEDRKGEIILSSKDGTLSEIVNIHQVAEGYLNIPEKQHEFSGIPEERDIEYSSNLDLKVIVPEGQDWLKVTLQENNIIRLKLEENQSEQDRTALITVQDYTGSYSETIQINQKYIPYYLRCPNNVTSDKGTYATGYKGAFFAHYIESDGPYKFEILTDDGTSWVRHIRQEKLGENQYHEVYELDENDTGKERSCIIRVSLGVIVLEYQLVQYQKRELILSQTEYVISSEGGDFPLKIKAGGEWAKENGEFWLYSILEDATSWVSIGRIPRHDSMEDVAQIIVQPNYTNQSRSTTILIYVFAGEEYYIDIHQSSAGAIVVSPKTNYLLSSDTHTETITLATSDYSVEIDGDWISLGQKSNDTEGAKQEILISENSTNQERKGTVTFSSGSTKNQITFTQLMAPPELVDDTPEKWHDFPLPEVTLTFTNPDSEGSQIYQAIVPDCEKLIAISSHKVLDCLYSDPSDSRIPRPKTLEYVLEDFDGVSYNAGTKIGLSNQYLAGYYKEFGAEAMIKENIGILSHEITHSYQAEPKNCGGYTSGTHFFAFIEGVADAVRVLCGGFPNDSDRPRGGHYMNGYRETGFFLAWLVNNKDADFLRKFNESAHELETWTFDAGIKYALGESASADALWTEYQIAMGDI